MEPVVNKVCDFHAFLDSPEIKESYEAHCTNCGKLYAITNPPDEMPDPKEPRFNFCPSCLSTDEGT